MKKLVSTLLVACILATAGLAFTACKPNENPHEHAYSSAWSKDETYHWHACAGTGCDSVSEKEEHSFEWVIDEEATTEKEGLKHEECECGATRSENTVINKLPGENPMGPSKVPDAISPIHGHEYSSAWSKDETYHWHACTGADCDSVSEKEEHSFEWVIDEEATTEKEGLKHKECECGATRSENTVIDKLHYDSVIIIPDEFKDVGGDEKHDDEKHYVPKITVDGYKDIDELAAAFCLSNVIVGEYVIYHADKEIEQNNVLAVDGNKWIYDIDLVETEEENIYRPKTTVRFDGSDCYANGVKVDYYRRPKVFEVIGVLRMHVPRYVTLTSGEGLPEGMDEDVARDMARSLENDVSAELAYILELSGGLLNCHINVSGDKLSDIYLWFDAKEGRVEYNYRFQNWGEVIVYQDRYELR